MKKNHLFHFPETSTSEARADIHSMNVDQCMVIPDTPDRGSKQKNVCQGTSVSTYFNSRNTVLPNEASSDRRFHVFGDKGKTPGMSYFHGTDFDAKHSHEAKISVVPPFDIKNAPRPVVDRNFKNKGKHHFDHHFMDNDISHSRRPGVPSHCSDRHGFPIFDHGEAARSSLKSIGEGSDVESKSQSCHLFSKHESSHPVVTFFKPSRSESKGKAEIANDKAVASDAYGGTNSTTDVASEHRTGKGMSVPLQSFRGPNRTRQKRLVRNGCISPNNIAKRLKSSESSANGSTNIEFNTVSGGSHHVIDVDESISKGSTAKQSNGKGVRIESSSSMGQEGRGNDTGCSVDGWRTVSKNSNKIVQGKSSSSSNPTSDFMGMVNGGQLSTPTKSIGRLKKHEISSSSSDMNKEIICLSSGGEPSAAKSAGDLVGRPQRGFGSPLVVGDFSPEVRESDTQMSNDSETRAVQLQADEMLARELQEQLYNEIPDATVGEVIPRSDLEGSVHPSSSRGSHHARANMGFPAANTRRESHLPSLRDRVFPRRARTRGGGRPPSSNVTRFRNLIEHGFPRAAFRGRDRGPMLFPLDMDVDMRIDMLEALEAVANEDIMMVNQLFDVDREFNENDYEMLLALDDNNHGHLGASVAQIANLPESTVLKDDCEVCSICLESPVIGDTMRHLPCLHKFHKDCIDPWLRRKRSCPVCKSDI